MKLRFFASILLISAACLPPLPAAENGGAWIDVPFLSQTKNGCGSAAIAMVMRYWSGKQGRAVPASAEPARIQSALYSPDAKGIRASDMQRYFQAAGYDAFAFAATWDDVKHHLVLGRPLIVCLRANGPREPLHYAVLVGIDWERGYVFLNDPAQQKRLRVSRQGFESEWRPLHNWTLLAVPRTSD